jgi:hypothetical protein
MNGENENSELMGIFPTLELSRKQTEDLHAVKSKSKKVSQRILNTFSKLITQ